MDPDRIDINLISSWIRTCDRVHVGEDAAANTNIASALTENDLPFLYLIDLEQECLVRIPLSTRTGEEKACPRYVALSYVWGKVEIPMTTTKNLQLLQTPGALSPQTFLRINKGKRLTRTIEDAMHLARQLGIRFFWTDCFCIVQDGGAEKTMFINAMAFIYARAYFTIVAGEGAHGDFGIPGIDSSRPTYDSNGADDGSGTVGQQQQLPRRDIMCRYMKFPGPVTLQTEHINEHAARSVCNGTPWATRAWTFQEASSHAGCSCATGPSAGFVGTT